MLHDNQRIRPTDRFFVCGGNPDSDSGGGVIGSRQEWHEAITLKELAIKAGYRKVTILTWNELHTVTGAYL